MSKGNLFMGNASGKLADVVLYRNAGAQVARLRVRNPKNPRTEAQIIQRVVQGTVAKAYSVMQFICNHSFEGKASKTDNQSAFMKANVAKLRELIAASPSSYRNNFAFNSRNVQDPLPNAYIIAQGQLPEIPIGVTHSAYEFLSLTLGETPTYQDVADGLGLKKGDQITIVGIVGDTTYTKMVGMRVARIILEPSSGDMTAAFLSGRSINLPNPKNEGELGAIAVEDGALVIAADPAGAVETIIGGAVIASRYQDGKWLRSNATLNNIATEANRLGDAIDSWMPSHSSDKYLNQAED